MESYHNKCFLFLQPIIHCLSNISNVLPPGKSQRRFFYVIFFYQYKAACLLRRRNRSCYGHFLFKTVPSADGWLCDAVQYAVHLSDWVLVRLTYRPDGSLRLRHFAACGRPLYHQYSADAYRLSFRVRRTWTFRHFLR